MGSAGLKKRRGARTAVAWAAGLAAICFSTVGMAQSAPEQIEFFEKKIRPVLAEKCYLCHSAKTTAMAGLLLDSKQGLLKGGSRGPSIVPGEPESSLLLTAISYRNLDLKMPPGGKLSDDEIAGFSAWVRMGAPDPRIDEAVAAPKQEQPGYNFAEARKFWSFQPVKAEQPPAVKRADWPQSPIDNFVLAKLEAEGFSPAPPAEKRALIRRVTFDLTGLPPTPKEIGDFLADDSPRAFEKVVERLLGSPRYGERWARHWLDLVRFAETNGHEFDNDKLDAFRYRDYVIRAFNDDLPYDVFIKEQIAGDLLASQREVADGSRYDSPVGTGLYWFGEVLNSAVDSVKSRADEVDNQIDVMSKAFQGLTVACARCHDHKFDPIPTKDYYSLAGFLHSTTMSEECIDSAGRHLEIEAQYHKAAAANSAIAKALSPLFATQAGTLKAVLAAAARVQAGVELKDGRRQEKALAEVAEKANQWARQSGIDAGRLEAWSKRLWIASRQADDVFYPLAALARGTPDDGKSFSARAASLGREIDQAARNVAAGDRGGDSSYILFEDFEKASYEGWTVGGNAFGDGPLNRIAPNQALASHRNEGIANSFRGGSDRLVGTLTSKKFKMPKLYVHVRMGGSKETGRKETAALRFTIVADAHKSGHEMPNGNGALEWHTLTMTKEIGRICYIEIVDRSRDGHLAVDKIVFSDSPEPPKLSSPPDPRVRKLLDYPGLDSLDRLAAAYVEMFSDAAARGDSPGLLAALSPSGRAEDLTELLENAERAKFNDLAAARQKAEDAIPPSAFAMVSSDEDPHDVGIHIRGNHKNLGEPAPRRFLQVIDGPDHPPVTNGSGRLALAERIAAADNPLTARVMVNRIWKHHFGQGIVGTVDNFGETGERPTHPELLDFLAKRFVDSGWSVKEMHRLMVLGSTYRMSSRANERAAAADPLNKWLHHMPVKRLEAEAIRDAILSVAGTLDEQLYGPSVMPHISPYQDGRGKPESGPLDGDGRRSVYIQVRRNFLTPLFLAFDYPLPISAIGRRGVSAVPSQALIMMNNEFVTAQAGKWAARVMAERANGRERVRDMFLGAFGRPPSDDEISGSLEFVERQAAVYTKSGVNDDARVWADLGHVLLNSTEFIFVQ